MISESARATSAAETRFRIPSGASVARTVTVVALDPASDTVVAKLSEGSWKGVDFFPAAAVADRKAGDVAKADLVVMVTTAGADASAAAVIGQACSDRQVPTATFVVRGKASDEALSQTLVQVRPWSLMVVVASEDDYLEDILRSFR